VQARSESQKKLQVLPQLPKHNPSQQPQPKLTLLAGDLVVSAGSGMRGASSVNMLHQSMAPRMSVVRSLIMGLVGVRPLVGLVGVRSLAAKTGRILVFLAVTRVIRRGVTAGERSDEAGSTKVKSPGTSEASAEEEPLEVAQPGAAAMISWWSSRAMVSPVVVVAAAAAVSLKVRTGASEARRRPAEGGDLGGRGLSITGAGAGSAISAAVGTCMGKGVIGRGVMPCENSCSVHAAAMGA